MNEYLIFGIILIIVLLAIIISTPECKEKFNIRTYISWLIIMWLFYFLLIQLSYDISSPYLIALSMYNIVISLFLSLITVNLIQAVYFRWIKKDYDEDCSDTQSSISYCSDDEEVEVLLKLKGLQWKN